MKTPKERYWENPEKFRKKARLWSKRHRQQETTKQRIYRSDETIRLIHNEQERQRYYKSRRAKVLARLRKHRADWIALHGGKCETCGAVSRLIVVGDGILEKISWSWAWKRLKALQHRRVLCRECEGAERRGIARSNIKLR